MKIKDILKRIGKLLNDTWYVCSPFLIFKLFQMILTIGEFKGTMWVICYLLILVVCYGTVFYRINKQIESIEKEVK